MIFEVWWAFSIWKGRHSVYFSCSLCTSHFSLHMAFSTSQIPGPFSSILQTWDFPDLSFGRLMGFMEKKPARGCELPLFVAPLLGASRSASSRAATLHPLICHPDWTLLTAVLLHWAPGNQKTQQKFSLTDRKGEGRRERVKEERREGGKMEERDGENNFNFFLLISVLRFLENDLIGCFQSAVHPRHMDLVEGELTAGYRTVVSIITVWMKRSEMWAQYTEKWPKAEQMQQHGLVQEL